MPMPCEWGSAHSGIHLFSEGIELGAGGARFHKKYNDIFLRAPRVISPNSEKKRGKSDKSHKARRNARRQGFKFRQRDFCALRALFYGRKLTISLYSSHVAK